MKQQKSNHPVSRAKSFSFAFNGLYRLVQSEPNARIHAIATIAVIAAGFARHISPAQWIAIVFAIAIVWITEALNTCVEKLCDFCCDNQWLPTIKIIKDISAAAVLVAAIASIAIGIIIFFF